MVFFIWTRLGFLVPLIALAAMFAGGALLVATDSPYFLSLFMLIAGGALWFLGRALNNRPGRTLIDKESGQEVVVRRSHTFFWVKMEYWGILIAAYAVVSAIM